MLQKTCTPDFLTGKQKKNCGEKSMFLVENAHELIVSKEVFEEVQRQKAKCNSRQSRIFCVIIDF